LSSLTVRRFGAADESVERRRRREVGRRCAGKVEFYY